MHVAFEALATAAYLDYSLDSHAYHREAEERAKDEDNVVDDRPEDVEDAGGDRAVHLCGVLGNVLRVYSQENYVLLSYTVRGCIRRRTSILDGPRDVSY